MASASNFGAAVRGGARGSGPADTGRGSAVVEAPASFCDWMLRGCIAIIGVAVAGILLYYGLMYFGAKCEQPLAIWSLVAAGLLILTAFVFLIDSSCAWANGLLWLASSDPVATRKKTDAAAGAKQPSAAIGFMIVQGTLLLALVAAFVYGAYAILEMFGRQRNASPGAEVCDRRLYDPLFFLVLLFDLVVIVAVALFLCVAACDGSKCICRCGCGQRDGKDGKAGSTGSGKGSGSGTGSGSSSSSSTSTGEASAHTDVGATESTHLLAEEGDAEAGHAKQTATSGAGAAAVATAAAPAPAGEQQEQSASKTA